MNGEDSPRLGKKSVMRVDASSERAFDGTFAFSLSCLCFPAPSEVLCTVKYVQSCCVLMILTYIPIKLERTAILPATAPPFVWTIHNRYALRFLSIRVGDARCKGHDHIGSES